MKLRWLRQTLTNWFRKPWDSLEEKRLHLEVSRGVRPRHIGVILDGNRRFARATGLSRAVDGHARGANKLQEMLEWCYEYRIPVVTIWIFSLDNFQREDDEVDGLFELIERHTRLLTRDPKIHQRGVRLRYMGRTELLPQSLQEAIEEAEEATRHHETLLLNIAIAYGGREEITDAFGRYLEAAQAQGMSLEELRTEMQPDALTPFLYTSGLPEPDLIIRTSGEFRLSGFLLWQSAYAEFYFCDAMWPAFRRLDLLRALHAYSRRQRRFGR